MKPKTVRVVRCKKMRLMASYIRIIGTDEKGKLWDMVAEIRPIKKRGGR